jgi:hypothetical protein
MSESSSDELLHESSLDSPEPSEEEEDEDWEEQTATKLRHDKNREVAATHREIARILLKTSGILFKHLQ